MMRSGLPDFALRSRPPPPHEAAKHRAASSTTNASAYARRVFSERRFINSLLLDGGRLFRLASVRAVATAALTAAAAPKVIAGGEDDVRAFAVEVFALDECGRLSVQVVTHDYTQQQ